MTVIATNLISGNSECNWENPLEFATSYRSLIPGNNQISLQFISEGKLLDVNIGLQDSNTGILTLEFNSMASYNEYKTHANNDFVTILTNAGWSREETVQET